MRGGGVVGILVPVRFLRLRLDTEQRVSAAYGLMPRIPKAVCLHMGVLVPGLSVYVSGTRVLVQVHFLFCIRSLKRHRSMAVSGFNHNPQPTPHPCTYPHTHSLHWDGAVETMEDGKSQACCRALSAVWCQLG